MVLNLKFSKFDDTPWGFRLIGGIDFEVPLTVIKVNEGGLAEAAGLIEGDVVVRINETSTINLTHLDVHALLKQSGNNFMLGVLRETEEEVPTQQSSFKTTEILTEDHSVSVRSEMASSSHSESRSESCLEIQQEEQLETTMDQEITEEAIAEIMSGEAEVLKEHNVLGVNFKKIIPQTGYIKNSEVFHQLNNEAMKTKDEMDKEQKKWSTFLQRPDRPVPQKKSELIEQEKLKSEGYKVRIVKQPQPKVAPGRIPTPPPIANEEPMHIETMEEPSIKSEISEEETNIQINDDDVPDLNPSEHSESRPATNLSNHTDIEQIDDNIDENDCAEENGPIEKEKTEEEIYLEKQLAAVQQQLLALSNLPLTIQNALDEVTKKLSSIVPAIAQVKEKKLITENESQCINSNEMDEENVEKVEDINDTEQINSENEAIANEVIESQDSDTTNKNIEITNDQKISETNGEAINEDAEKSAIDPDWQYKRHDAQLKEQLIEELELEHQQRLICERTPKRPARHAFGPLTPQERPIFLPGGRKWRKPKDAFNEEFIAEVLTSQAELIVGTTLGRSYESPLLPYDERVNFLKYEKPEKKVNLEQSEVYRLIHHLDAEPKSGISARSEKVAAMQDIRVA